MTRPKLNVTEVYVVSEVVPYEGSTMIAAHATLDGAKKDRRGPWIEDEEGALWIQKKVHDQYNYLIIERQDLQP